MAALDGFMQRYRAYRHDHILNMPYVLFIRMCLQIGKVKRQADHKRYFRGQPLLEAEWEEHAEEWLKAQGLA